jgi:hypothetical protein
MIVELELDRHNHEFTNPMVVIMVINWPEIGSLYGSFRIMLADARAYF